jgi:hypothetical protein
MACVKEMVRRNSLRWTGSIRAGGCDAAVYAEMHYLDPEMGHRDMECSASGLCTVSNVFLDAVEDHIFPSIANNKPQFHDS